MFKIKCPKCNTGELILYKETEITYRHSLTKANKIRKKPFFTIEEDTTKDYLECENSKCGQLFDYDIDDKGRVFDISERHHGSY